MEVSSTSRAKKPSRARLVRLACFGILVSASWFFASHTQAANQGTTGPDSSGSIDITYTTGLFSRINGFADMPLGTWSGSGPLTANDNLCIARTGISLFGSGTYRILAQGDGAPGNPGEFTLTNGTDLLFYNVYFNDQAGTVGRTQLSGGVALTGQSSSGFAYFLNMIFGCVVQNANISIEVPESELMASAGAYTGTLAITLIPE